MGCYCSELATFNSHTNLVSNADPEALVTEHIVDSLSLVKFIDNFKRQKANGSEFVTMVDIGSGAGLPGLIIAIALPYLRVTLIDSVGKKVKFLETAITALGLGERVRATSQRAEELGHHPRYRSNFDIATARAVGTFDMVAELAMPLLKVGGQLYVQKSLNQLDEASKQASRCLPVLGGLILDATALDARILGKDRVILVAEKRSKTAEHYPRTWAQIKNKPIG